MCWGVKFQGGQMRTIIATSGGLLIGGRVALSVTALSQTSQSPKSLTSRKGVPLAELIRREPRAVVPSATVGQPPSVAVVKDQKPPLGVLPPPGMRQLEWITSLVPVVVVVEIERSEPN